MKLRSQYDEIIKSVSQSYMPEIDWRLFKAQIWAESAFDSEAKSPAGARGLGQIMPGTWEEWSAKLGVVNINNPSENLKVAAAYMKYLRDTWKMKRPEMDKHCLALASYNAGIGNILAAQKLVDGSVLYGDIIRKLTFVTGRHSVETINYVKKILNRYVKEVVS